ncbi:SRPBCC family protein [Aquihabitans daechungensis]|uniref:SRPBCC family protein n=1 Tax=Aquihabitans daechungensis TaxID=1052257 RepID=UPI003B9ED55A
MATYIPQDLAFAETAPIIIESTAVVAATRSEVWAVICDHERWPEWFGSLTSVRSISTPASGVGSTREVKLSGGFTFQEEFIAWDEPELWAFTGTSGPGPFRSLVERVTLVELDPGRTEVTYRMAIEPRRGFGPVLKVARGGIAKNLAKALRQLDGATAARRDQPS